MKLNLFCYHRFVYSYYYKANYSWGFCLTNVFYTGRIYLTIYMQF